MTSINPDGARAEIRENALVAGNPVKNASKIPVSAVTQLTGSATGVLQQTQALPIAEAAITDSFISLTGTPNGNIMTQSLVAGASATTATIGGWYRITVVSANEAIMSSGAYYVPMYTLT